MRLPTLAAAGQWSEKVKKYLHVQNIGIQNQLVYRVNFLFRACFGLLPLIATISLWRTVYGGKEGDSIGSYTLAQMISYYLVVTLVDMFTAVNEDDWQIAADIRDGNISQFLLKPIDYLRYRLCLFLAGRAIYTTVALVPVAIFILVQREYFVAPDWNTFGWFTLSVLMTALLQFFMSYAMALLAFWVLEVSTFIFILFAFEYIAGGHMFPLDILPPAILKVLSFTPFPYQMYFPVSIYVGKSTGAALYQGLVIQFLWVVAAYLFARFMWARGIRKYSAVGG
jgi:ABC-2 type transport system permease protein